MSDTLLSGNPYRPALAASSRPTEHARSVVAGLLQWNAPGFHELKVTWHAQVAVVDCGENLQRISAPHCAA